MGVAARSGVLNIAAILRQYKVQRFSLLLTINNSLNTIFGRKFDF